jgi:hypothetical protein
VASSGSSSIFPSPLPRTTPRSLPPKTVPFPKSSACSFGLPTPLVRISLTPLPFFLVPSVAKISLTDKLRRTSCATFEENPISLRRIPPIRTTAESSRHTSTRLGRLSADSTLDHCLHRSNARGSCLLTVNSSRKLSSWQRPSPRTTQPHLDPTFPPRARPPSSRPYPSINTSSSRRFSRVSFFSLTATHPS